MRILHCSDVHITATTYFRTPPWKLGWRRTLALVELAFGGRGRDYVEAKETLSQIAQDAERLKVSHVILSGDVTQYALESEFEGARTALGRLAEDPQRLSMIPGNHDTFTRQAGVEDWFARYFGNLLKSDLPEHCREGAYPVVRLLGEGAAVIGLRSARVPPVPGLSYGWLGAKQLEGLDAILADPRLQGRAVFVVVHHAPLTSAGKTDLVTHRLLDAPQLLSRLKGPRFAVLHGHIHERFHHPATSDRPHLFGAGSSTERGHEGYWLIDVRDGQIRGGTKCLPGQ